jgi:membrane fusion protein (multidrug efflux system)
MSAAARLRKLVRAVFLLGVPLAAVAGGLHYYAEGGGRVETDNAYVKAHVIAVSAEVAGRVLEVGVADNQVVQAGELLFRIDPAPFEVAVARADAQLASVRTEVETLRAEHRVALAEIAEAEARVGFLTVQLERQRRLRERGMVREEAYDEARYQLEDARARVASVRERAARVLAGLGGDPGLPAARHPRVLEAQAERAAAALDLRARACMRPRPAR